MANQKGEQHTLSGELASISVGDTRIHLVLKIRNTAERALHYISDVRTLRYDSVNKELVVSLSDEGREVIPGAASKLPKFRHINPGNEAEIHLDVPKKIVKLSRSVPPGELGFESHQLTEAVDIVVNVAYADVPYYPDTRETELKTLPAVQWQQDKLIMRKSFKPG